MRAASEIKSLQVRSGTVGQVQTDSAVASLLQQAQQAEPYSMQPPPPAGPPNGHHHIKQEPDLQTSINPAHMMLPSSKRALSVSEDSKPKKVKATRSDIDLDNEAINSDLDDSDDDALRAEGDGNDDGDVQTVLCLYDKVQRTKNKWKCVLKDGIVSINNKDYAFNKANGEFEW